MMTKQPMSRSDGKSLVFNGRLDGRWSHRSLFTDEFAVRTKAAVTVVTDKNASDKGIFMHSSCL